MSPPPAAATATIAPTTAPVVAIVAGEQSGDLLGADLIAALRARVPALQIEGVAGPAMQAAGCRAIYPMERLSVMGLVEVAGRYVSLMRDRRRLGAYWIANRPDIFVGIDAPDFNLGLERRLRRHGIRTVHYVSPSVWAWRRYRIHGIRKAVDRMLTLFPFEAAFYTRSGVNVEHVGHPLADLIDERVDAAECRARLGVAFGVRTVALLPGSRNTEVAELGGLMLRTAAWLAERAPDLQFVMPAATDAIHARLAALIAEHDASVILVRGQARAVIGASDVVVLASGTATLEALLTKRPMVITYRMHPVTFRIMKWLMHVRHVGLPNLLAGEEVVPERLQDEATPERVGQDVLDWLESPDRVRALMSTFDDIHRQLKCDASARAADAILDVMRS